MSPMSALSFSESGNSPPSTARVRRRRDLADPSLPSFKTDPAVPQKPSWTDIKNSATRRIDRDNVVPRISGTSRVGGGA